MRSLRQAFSSFADASQTISVNSVISTFPISRPQWVAHFCTSSTKAGPSPDSVAGMRRWSTSMTFPGRRLWASLVFITYPAAHLGFGTQLFYGSPDGDPAIDFDYCNVYHGGPGPDNPNGNLIRQQVVDGVAQQGTHRPGTITALVGPTFQPGRHGMINFISRFGSRRLSVPGRAACGLLWRSRSITIPSQKSVKRKGRTTTKSAGDAQNAAIKEMVASQAFMELAPSPSDVRQIVGAGKLAVVIGTELDCIGNFYIPSDLDTDHCSSPFNPVPSPDDIHAEVNRLFASGVRYFFPVHVLDNIFGGAALYELSFNVANRYEFDSFYAPGAGAALLADWLYICSGRRLLGPSL